MLFFRSGRPRANYRDFGLSGHIVKKCLTSLTHSSLVGFVKDGKKDYFFTIVSKEVLVLVLVLFLLFSLVHMLCLASSFNFLGQAEA